MNSNRYPQYDTHGVTEHLPQSMYGQQMTHMGQPTNVQPQSHPMYTNSVQNAPLHQGLPPSSHMGIPSHPSNMQQQISGHMSHSLPPSHIPNHEMGYSQQIHRSGSADLYHPSHQMPQGRAPLPSQMNHMPSSTSTHPSSVQSMQPMQSMQSMQNINQQPSSHQMMSHGSSVGSSSMNIPPPHTIPPPSTSIPPPPIQSPYMQQSTYGSNIHGQPPPPSAHIQHMHPNQHEISAPQSHQPISHAPMHSMHPSSHSQSLPPPPIHQGRPISSSYPSSAPISNPSTYSSNQTPPSNIPPQVSIQPQSQQQVLLPQQGQQSFGSQSQEIPSIELLEPPFQYGPSLNASSYLFVPCDILKFEEFYLDYPADD